MSSRTDSARAAVLVLAAALALTLAPAAPAAARTLKLWPLFEYRSDATAATRTLKALGPLIEVHSDPDYVRIAVRPLFSIRQARVGHHDEVRILYPLLTSRWEPDYQTTRGLAGVFNYRTGTTPDGRTLTAQRFRAYPFYFYEWERDRGVQTSIIPLYADLEDFFGFDRVRMVLFPAYLRLDRQLVERRYVLFPFFGDVGGPLGSGFRVWPIYGRKRFGETYDSGFVLWPFWVWDERTNQGESERRLVAFPFYSRIAGPRRESTAYGTLFYTHTVDRSAMLETWGFPWPLWMYQRAIGTGARTTFRLFPFYQDRRQGQLAARFVAWPLYRERTQHDDELLYERKDALLMIYRDEDRADLVRGTSAELTTLFPLWRAQRDDDVTQGGAPALLDAVLPRNPALTELYAPLWQVYAWEGPVGAPRWNVGWGAVTHQDGETTYPWRWEW